MKGSVAVSYGEYGMGLPLVVARILRHYPNGAVLATALGVALRPTGVEPPYDLIAVTADPAEGEAFTQNGDHLVDVVPMPE